MSFAPGRIASSAIRALLAMATACLPACTNYTAETQNINPPIIISVVAEGTGHLITVAAQNAEIGFFGYRLYQATDEAAVRAINPNNGTDCGALAILPDQAQNYVIEVKPGQTAPTAGTTDSRICALPAALTSGGVVALRALGFSISSLNTSVISNAVVVP
ncbi:MAG: hypothetical protein NXI24_09185 [bacterium]|nr:hypothetical protein [bacterium]